MTPDQYEKLKQVAREWIRSHFGFVLNTPEKVESLTALLAVQRAAVLEEALAIVKERELDPCDEENDNKCPKQDGDGTSWNRALLSVRTELQHLLKQAQEQRP